MAPEIVFLNGDPRVSQRERELIDARRKSYSARIAHAKRKAKNTASEGKECRIRHHKSESRPSSTSSIERQPTFQSLQSEGSFSCITELSSERSLKSQGISNSRSSSLSEHSRLSRSESRTSSPNSIASLEQPAEETQPVPLVLIRGSLHRNESFDPFNIFPIVLNNHDFSVIRYYLQFGVVNTRRTEAMVKTQPFEIDLNSSVVKYKTFVALTEETSTYALLATAAARMAQTSFTPHNLEEKTTYYIGCAINKLRRDLAAQDFKPNLSTLKTITRLASAEWARGNQFIAQYHVTSMSKMAGESWEELLAITGEASYAECLSRYDINMAAEWGLFPKMHRPPRVLAMKSDQYSKVCESLNNLHLDASSGMLMGLKTHDLAAFEDAMLGRCRPFLLNTERSSSFFDSDLANISSKTIRASFARGFIDLALHNVLCDEFKTFILDLIPQWTDLLLLCFSSEDEAIPEHAAWLDDRTMMALGDLLFLQKQTASDLRQESLRLTLVMILTDMTSPFHWRAVAFNLKQLKKNLEVLEATERNFRAAYHPSPIEGSMMLWVLCVALCAAVAAQGRETALKEVMWWKQRAASLCLLMQVHKMTDLFTVMVKYIHSGLVRHVAMVDLMEFVTARVAQRKTLDHT